MNLYDEDAVTANASTNTRELHAPWLTHEFMLFKTANHTRRGLYNGQRLTELKAGSRR